MNDVNMERFQYKHFVFTIWLAGLIKGIAIGVLIMIMLSLLKG